MITPLIRISSLCALVFTAGLVLVTSVSLAAEKTRFNIISIVTDDQAQWSVGAYGNRESRTPNMDRLAREGARFLNAFACTPVCSPSRASFLTGRYGTQLGVTDWITPKEARAGVGLSADSVTWPKLLRQRGYVTGLAGKWHLGALPQFHPSRLGFDFFTGALGGSFKPKDPELEVNGELKQLEGFGADVVMDAALGFIETNRTRPFALLIHFREPHLPYDPVPDEDAAPFKELDPTIPAFPNLKTNQVKNWTRLYYAAIHSVDRNLGRLLARLDEWQLADHTIVMFTSDHGYMIGQHGIHMKGNGRLIAGDQAGTTRPNMFEESLLVPLIIRWPGVVSRGREIAEPVSNIDTYATVLGMLGVKPPKRWKQEGIDLTPLLRGRKLTPHDAIFGQYDLHIDAVDSLRMIRTPEWKLIRHSKGQDELYHLTVDPGENENLFAEPKFTKIREELQIKLTAWQRSINDPALLRVKKE